MGYKNLGLHILAILAGLSITATARAADWVPPAPFNAWGTGGAPIVVVTPSVPEVPATPASCNGVPYEGTDADCTAAGGSYVPGTQGTPAKPAETTVNSDVKVNGALFVDGRNVGTALSDHDAAILGLQGTSAEHGGKISALEGRADASDAKNAEQDGRLDGHDDEIASMKSTKADKSYVDDRNAEQNKRLDGHDKTLKQHDERIGATEAKNAEQDETLKQHDGRITKVQSQADATDGRLNSYNGTGNTIEHWSSGVDAWRNDVNEWRGGVDYTLANHGSRLNALEDWRNIAEGQIAALQGDVKRLHRAIAVATALTIPHVDPDKRFALTVSGAGVDGEGAGAIAAAIKIDRNIQGFVGAGTSFSGGPAAVKGGVTFQW